MQKFSYTPTNPFSGSLSSLAIGAGMVIVPLVYPFGIRIGRMPILGATATTIIFVVGGLALLTFTVREIMQARKLIAQGGEITVDGDLVTIPVVKKGTVTNESFIHTAIREQPAYLLRLSFRLRYDVLSKSLTVSFPKDVILSASLHPTRDQT